MRIIHEMAVKPVVYAMAEAGTAPVYGYVDVEAVADIPELCAWLATVQPTGITPVTTTETCRPVRQFWVIAGEQQVMIDSSILDVDIMQSIHTAVAEHFNIC